MPSASASPSCTSCAAGSAAARGRRSACCSTSRRWARPRARGWRILRHDRGRLRDRRGGSAAAWARARCWACARAALPDFRFADLGAPPGPAARSPGTWPSGCADAADPGRRAGRGRYACCCTCSSAMTPCGCSPPAERGRRRRRARRAFRRHRRCRRRSPASCLPRRSCRARTACVARHEHQESIGRDRRGRHEHADQLAVMAAGDVGRWARR